MLLVVFVGLVCNQAQVLGYWDKEVHCPEVCKCRLEHVSETPIHRFMPKEEGIDNPTISEAIVLESNDVFDDTDGYSFDETSFFRTATCVIQTELTVPKLLEQLPKEINSLTIIQATNAGNKTFKFSDFELFEDLKILDIQSSPSIIASQQRFYISLDIDIPLEKLEYLNLERVILSNAIDRLQAFENEVIVFEHVQKSEDGQSLTFLEKRTGEILPYQMYKEKLRGEEGPIFMGFASLLLLRLYECEIHHIHREMFEGLGNLNYLLLERNRLQFISEFAFYGAPNLKTLSLAWNNLLNIEITDLAGLLELEHLDLSHNNFTQLSELSLPPFPKLKLCNFANNPITVVFPNTFEVMNTTYALIVGGLEEPMTLQTNSFLGLNLLMSLKLYYLNIPLFERDILRGMPNLQVLVMSGNIAEIQYDAFLEVTNLDTLIVSLCNLSKLSVDAFIGLEKLRVLDLSKNNLYTLPPSIFDVLSGLHELYLHSNHFQTLPQNIFGNIPARLIRLNENPWHCSCDMSDWKPIIVNRIKQKTIRTCENTGDKGLSCQQKNKIYYKYVYENSVAPKCLTPKKFVNWSVFHVMRRQFKCVEFKPRMKKKMRKRLQKVNVNTENTTDHHEEVQSEEENYDMTESNHKEKNANLTETTPVEHADLTTFNKMAISTEISEIQENGSDYNENLRAMKQEKLNRKYQRAMKLQKYIEMKKSLLPEDHIPAENNSENNSL